MEDKINEIIAEIAKRHKIILDRDDPVLAVITANEIMLEEYLTKIDRKEQKHLTDIEGMTAKYIADAKELAEIKIGAAVEHTIVILDEKHKNALKEIEAATKKAADGLAASNIAIKMNYFILSFGVIVALLLGLFIGRLL
jgi:hypothetical protein